MGWTQVLSGSRLSKTRERVLAQECQFGGAGVKSQPAPAPVVNLLTEGFDVMRQIGQAQAGGTQLLSSYVDNNETAWKAAGVHFRGAYVPTMTGLNPCWCMDPDMMGMEPAARSTAMIDYVKALAHLTHHCTEQGYIVGVDLGLMTGGNTSRSDGLDYVVDTSNKFLVSLRCMRTAMQGVVFTHAVYLSIHQRDCAYLSLIFQCAEFSRQRDYVQLRRPGAHGLRCTAHWIQARSSHAAI